MDVDWSLTKFLHHTSTWASNYILEKPVLILGIVKQSLVIPILRIVVILWLILLFMLSIEVAYMGIVIIVLKLLRRKSEQRYKWEPIRDDAELGSSALPMVLVQIPMYNEKEVYQLSIAAACSLSWPSDRLVIQILDGSTDPEIRDKVEVECQIWANKGINIKHEVRDNSNGYKAGALKEGMGLEYAKQCVYTVIFDADFQPNSDFLQRTVPFLIHNPELALVQTCWKYVNVDDCLMTRMQKMSQNYQFKMEHEVGSFMFSFFGFNGSAGVWRNAAINEAGGWKDRTTVEDADLSVRVFLQGWKFLYAGSVEVNSELPSSLKSYRSQQHRWSCGSANLFRKMLKEIIINEKASLWKKAYVIYSFFFIKKIVSPLVPFMYTCIVLPAITLVPEVSIPKVGAVSLVFVIILLEIVETLRSVPLLVCWIPFENVMSVLRTRAVTTGLVEVGRVNEWIVTEKLGETLLRSRSTTRAQEGARFRFAERLYLFELGTGLYLVLCGCYDIAFGRKAYYMYLYFQAIAFFIVGFGYVGKYVPSSYTQELC